MPSDDHCAALEECGPCPSWCVSDHDLQDHPDDHYHDSRASYLPVILERDSIPSSHGGEAAELVLVTSRKRGHPQAWTYIGEVDRPDQHLRLSPESARRLHRTLGRHLEDLGADLG